MRYYVHRIKWSLRNSIIHLQIFICVLVLNKLAGINTLNTLLNARRFSRTFLVTTADGCMCHSNWHPVWLIPGPWATISKHIATKSCPSVSMNVEICCTCFHYICTALLIMAGQIAEITRATTGNIRKLQGLSDLSRSMHKKRNNFTTHWLWVKNS